MPSSKHRVSVSHPVAEYAQLSATTQPSRVSMAWFVHATLIEFFARHHGKRSTSLFARFRALANDQHRISLAAAPSPRKNLFLPGQDGPL